MLTPAAQKAYISTLSETLAGPSKPHTPMRVEDVIRRSEVGRGGGREGEKGSLKEER